MRIYLSTNFWRIEEMRSVASTLNSMGMEVVSRWISIEKQELESDEYRKKWADIDVRDVSRCDIFVMEVMSIDIPQHGKHFELGLAHLQRKEIVLIGTPFHPFHEFAHVVVPNWDSAYEYLLERDRYYKGLGVK